MGVVSGVNGWHLCSTQSVLLERIQTISLLQGKTPPQAVRTQAAQGARGRLRGPKAIGDLGTPEVSARPGDPTKVEEPF